MIGIVCFLSTRYAQFAHKYINILEKNNITYEFVFWNREGEYKGGKDNWIPYNKELNTFQPFYKKIFAFCSFARYMRKIIKEKKYDKLVILISQTAIPLMDLLLFKYKNKYVFDYRDITYENFKLYRNIIDKIIEKSFFTAISSKGFTNYISDSAKLIISHNTRNFDLKQIEKEKYSKIRVVYWGMVRQLEFNCKVCDVFSKDQRFELYYHGAGYDKELKEYCEKKEYKNIKITGKYKLEEIEEFAKKSDIILNLYENDKRQKDAITVKFYDSIQYGIPMLVMEGSYMDKIVDKNYLGFSINIFENNALDKLYEKYTYFNYKKYKKNIYKIKRKIDEDDGNFEKKLLDFIYRE